MKPQQMVYQWGRKGFAVDPNIVGQEITKLERKHGACQPAALVEQAEKETSPLHKLFTWDDTKAAQNWRVHEARQVINALVVSVQIEDRTIKAPAFVSVGHVTDTMERGTGYRSVAAVMTDRDFAEEAMAEAMSKLRAIRERYAAIEALAPVWSVIDEHVAA